VADDVAYPCGDLLQRRPTLGREQPRQLADEERVAAAAPMDQIRIHLRPGEFASECTGCGRGETAQINPDRFGTGKARQPGRQQSADLGGPIGPDDQDRPVHRLGAQGTDQVQGAFVGPVQVIEDRQHWRPPAHRSQTIPGRPLIGATGRGAG